MLSQGQCDLVLSGLVCVFSMRQRASELQENQQFFSFAAFLGDVLGVVPLKEPDTLFLVIPNNTKLVWCHIWDPFTWFPVLHVLERLQISKHHVPSHHISTQKC